MKKFALLLAALCVALVAFAVPASAHVTVAAPGAIRGGSDQEITFRVPVEKKVDTVGLKIELPVATPIATVLVEPITGWTNTEQSTTLTTPIHTDDGDFTTAVTEISWTAKPGNGLKPGEFGAFTIIAGRLPDVAEIAFGAVQTYADGSVVNWNQVAAPGSTAQPDFPKPTLQLAAAQADSGAASTAAAPSTASSTATATATGASTTTKPASTTGATILGVIALVVAAGALGLSVVTRARRS